MWEFMSQVFTEQTIIYAETWVNDYFFILAAALFVFELIRYAVLKKLSWNLIGDSVANFVTLSLLLISVFLVGLAYVGVMVFVWQNWSISQLPITPWSLVGCIILADLAYYWEHRFLHSNGFAWATHAVHHSSPHFNISVAYRFGPLDWFFPFLFHIPLVMLGFNPFLVLLCETLVQLFQTLLHTETVKKLPRPIEAIFNTPSHHRVHHATNKQYLDKNYAGIFIIWDRMFGTFAKEEASVKYGVYPSINTVNPFKVYFHGYVSLIRQMKQAPNWQHSVQILLRSPIWTWEQAQQRKAVADDN